MKIPEQDIQAVFDKWNSYKGQWKWKSHRKMDYAIECAIKDILKHFDVEDICIAIDNYATILTGRQYSWSYAWPLDLFLTRHRPDDRKILQLTRFLPDRFNADEYLSKDGLRDKIASQHKPVAPFCVKYVPPTVEEKIAAIEKLPDSLIKRKMLAIHKQ